ncbi:helix-turn-helix domain-containing protein [Paenibacillus sp. HJGM_3]|uniref:helix-turn-helix domain-containing protein n=1 Tax=Paenibacillus sp. HJGM_3 TaxID=3379816 RepID=UPI00385F77D8
MKRVTEEDFIIERVKRTKPSTMAKYHYHEDYEIYYLLGGERTYYIENRSYDLKKGCLLFISKNDIHKTVDRAGPEHERMLVYVKDSYVEACGGADQYAFLMTPFHGTTKMLELPMAEQSYVEQLLFQLEQEYAEADRPGRDASIGALLVQLLVFAARRMAEQPARPSPGGAGDAKFAEIIAYCNEQYDKPLRLDTIASRFYISPYHFARLFKKKTGFTFTEYLNTVRIREAQRLIRETRHKIIQVAGLVGFANVSHFNRKFKEVTGMSPLEYRKMVKRPAALVD